MRKCFLIISIFIVLSLSITPETLARSLFIKGAITWETGSPASSLKVRLKNNNKVVAIGVTNASGIYAFFDVKGQPGDYTIQIISNKKVIHETSISNIAIGGTMSVIEIR